MIGRRLPFDFVEERKISAGDVFDLLREGTHANKISAGRIWHVVVFFRGHCFSDGQKLIRSVVQNVPDAVGDVFRNSILLGACRSRGHRKTEHQAGNEKYDLGSKRFHDGSPLRSANSASSRVATGPIYHMPS